MKSASGFIYIVNGALLAMTNASNYFLTKSIKILCSLRLWYEFDTFSLADCLSKQIFAFLLVSLVRVKFTIPGRVDMPLIIS